MSASQTETHTNWAAEAASLRDAYIAAGFTRDEAIALLVRPLVTIAAPTPSPDQAEFVARMTAWLNKQMGGDE